MISSGSGLSFPAWEAAREHDVPIFSRLLVLLIAEFARFRLQISTTVSDFYLFLFFLPESVVSSSTSSGSLLLKERPVGYLHSVRLLQFQAAGSREIYKKQRGKQTH